MRVARLQRRKENVADLSPAVKLLNFLSLDADHGTYNPRLDTETFLWHCVRQWAAAWWCAVEFFRKTFWSASTRRCAIIPSGRGRIWRAESAIGSIGAQPTASAKR